TAGPTELLPLGDESPVGVENLDTAVNTVSDIEASGRIKRDAMRCVELALCRPVSSPRLDEFAVLGELHNPVVGGTAVAVRDVDVAIGRDHDVGGTIEHILAVAGHAGFADGHQNLSLGTEFDQYGALAVLGAPVCRVDVAFVVHAQAVREVEHARSKARHELASRIELHDRGDV